MTKSKVNPDSLNEADGDVKLDDHIAKTSKMVEPDEIDELLDKHLNEIELRAGHRHLLKQQLLVLKSKWGAEAYKKGYIDGGINQLTTNGDK